MSTHPFRLMVAFRRVIDRDTLVEQVHRAEAVGFTHVAIHDHLAPQLAPIPLLTAVAMATDRLGLVPLVFNNDLRHPAVLAQELATLDILSRGRLTVGIGAGWNEPEYAASGIPFDPPATRIARMAEALTVLKGLFGPDPTTFHGRFYDIENLDGQPKPLQHPHPPFLVGGTRERVLRLAARNAQVVGLDLRQNREQIGDAFASRMDERVGWIRDEAGSSFAALELSVLRLLGPISVTTNARSAARDVTHDYTARTGLSVEPDKLLDSPYSLVGSIPQLAAKLREARERWGINSWLLGWFDEPEIWDLAPLVEQLSGT
jgi:probable F420-dependent oxidoreductase